MIRSARIRICYIFLFRHLNVYVVIVCLTTYIIKPNDSKQGFECVT